jgi:hypothetical protein
MIAYMSIGVGVGVGFVEGAQTGEAWGYCIG